MTTLALQSLNFSTKIFKSVGAFFKGICVSFIYARQMEANAKIVPFIRHEYKGKTDGEILRILNDKCMKELKK